MLNGFFVRVESSNLKINHPQILLEISSLLLVFCTLLALFQSLSASPQLLLTLLPECFDWRPILRKCWNTKTPAAVIL